MAFDEGVVPLSLQDEGQISYKCGVVADSPKLRAIAKKAALKLWTLLALPEGRFLLDPYMPPNLFLCLQYVPAGEHRVQLGQIGFPNKAYMVL